MNQPYKDNQGLLGSMIDGSLDAFDEFYEKYMPLVFHIAQKMLGERMEAEDVCHEVFIEVIKKGQEYDPRRGSIESWLAVKTRSRCLDHLRKKRQVLEEDMERVQSKQAHWADTTEDLVFSRIAGQALQQAMSRIPSSQREALFGMYYESLTHRELSERIGRPLGTVKSLIRYGLHNIRKQLTQFGWKDGSGGEER